MTTFWTLDVETTGVEHETDKVVELGGVLLHDKQVVKCHESLVNPGIPIPPQASAVHHITDSDVAEAPTLEQALAPIVEEPADYYVAHNAPFDAGFLKLDGAKWICTYRCALRLYPDAPSHGNQVLRYWLGVDSPKSTGYAHRALYDAEVTANIFARMMDAATTEDFLERMVAISAQPALLRKVGFGEHYGKLWSEVPTSYLRWMLSKPGWDEDKIFTAKHWYDKHMAR